MSSTILRGRLSAIASVAALLTQTTVALTQSDPNDAQAGFFETLDVNVVNIEVFVEDRNGRPVIDLTEEDFELFVDGHRVPISNFYVATEETLRARPRPDRAPEAREGVAEAIGDELAPRTYLILYIDNFNLRGPDRNRVLRALQRFVLGGLYPDIEMMLVTYDHSLSVRQAFTGDPRLIVDAARETERFAGMATSRDADRRLAADEIDDAKQEVEALSAASAYADARSTELTRPIEALTEIMDPLSGLPGKKALIYVSSGLPKRVGEDLFVLVESRFPRSRARMHAFQYDLTPKYESLVLAANTAGVTLYALDATGLQAFESLSAAESGSVRGGSFVEVDSVYQANLQAPLHQMAVGTGGQALTNSNNLDLMFGQLRQDLTTYYSLGYRPDPGQEGRYKDLEVKVKRPRARVRHRQGFRVLSQERKLEQGLIAALRLGKESNRFGLRSQVGLASAGSDGVLSLPFDVRIPLSQVTLVPNGEEWIGRLMVGVQAMDASGRISEVSRSQPLELRIPASDYDKALEQYVTWSVELVVDKGRQRVAIGAVDLLSGHLGFTTEALTVPGS